MPTRYTVTAAAHALNVSVSTVRRIADELSAHLPDYQPIPDAPRLFTEADVRAIAAILTRLQASPGLTRSALLRELSTGQGEPLIIPETLPTKAPSSPPDSPGRTLDVQAISTHPQQLTGPENTPHAVAVLATLTERIEKLESRPSPPDRPAQDSLSLLAAAVAVGVLIFALVGVAIWQNTAAAVACIAIALIAILLSIIAPLRR